MQPLPFVTSSQFVSQSSHLIVLRLRAISDIEYQFKNREWVLFVACCLSLKEGATPTRQTEMCVSQAPFLNLTKPLRHETAFPDGWLLPRAACTCSWLKGKLLVGRVVHGSRASTLQTSRRSMRRSTSHSRAGEAHLPS
eukprot:5154161-Amphidinium_carterae.1